MIVTKTEIPDVLLIEPRRFEDARGYFCETYNARSLAGELGGVTFVQDNHSFSHTRGTLRGLHFQSPPFAQDKLIRCVQGRILDVAVDLRHGSPHFGSWVSRELSRDNGHQLFVPKGFGHGFLTLTDDAEIIYKVSQFYEPSHDLGLMWNDPDISIDWGLEAGEHKSLSPKDAALPALRDLPAYFTYNAH
jgi:dTDP-4-dehydrorhamnose 3,5-epimerase